eukprot:1183061-Amorphochlora_amoeboformis.AAC.1
MNPIHFKHFTNSGTYFTYFMHAPMDGMDSISSMVEGWEALDGLRDWMHFNNGLERWEALDGRIVIVRIAGL